MPNRRVQMTRRLLKDALIELLQIKRLEKISVREICTRADVNRSTFYDHYQDIYALMRDVARDFIAQIPTQRSSEGIEAQLLSFVRYVQLNAQCYAAIRRLNGLLEEEVARILLENYRDRMAATPARGDAELFKIYVMYVVTGSCRTLDDWINGDSGEIDSQRMAEILLNMAYRMFQPPTA